MTNGTSLTDFADGVLALISDPQKWCQYVMARDKDGSMCPPYLDRACQWCLVGAMNRVAHQCGRWDVYAEFSTHAEDIANAPITDYNDKHSHAEVLRLVRQVREHVS